MQIIYLTIVVIGLVVMNVMLIIQKLKLNVEDLREEHPDEKITK